MALVGAAVFHGTFVESVPMIQVRVEYFIVGPSEENAIVIFVNSLLSDLKITPKQTQHVVMGQLMIKSSFVSQARLYGNINKK